MSLWEDVDKYICAEEWQRLPSAFRTAETQVFVSWLISMGSKLTAVFNWRGNMPFTRPSRCQENYSFWEAYSLTHSSLSALIFSVQCFPPKPLFSLWRRAWNKFILISSQVFLPHPAGFHGLIFCASDGRWHPDLIWGTWGRTMIPRC